MRWPLIAIACVAAGATAQVSYPPSANPARIVYSSSGETTVGNNSTARATMLPTAQTGTSLLIKAGTLPPGASLHLQGEGVISAATAGAGNFTFTPCFTPAGGSKTDMNGLTVAPLIGVVGITWIDMTITQTTTGLRPGGVINYAAANTNNNYPNIINAPGTVTASDWTVDRTLCIEGQWQNANANNYVTSRDVTIYMLPLS